MVPEGSGLATRLREPRPARPPAGQSQLGSVRARAGEIRRRILRNRGRSPAQTHSSDRARWTRQRPLCDSRERGASRVQTAEWARAGFRIRSPGGSADTCLRVWSRETRRSTAPANKLAQKPWLWRARLSRFGVSLAFEPRKPMRSARVESSVTRTILGLAAAPDATGDKTIKAARNTSNNFLRSMQSVYRRAQNTGTRASAPAPPTRRLDTDCPAGENHGLPCTSYESRSLVSSCWCALPLC